MLPDPDREAIDASEHLFHAIGSICVGKPVADAVNALASALSVAITHGSDSLDVAVAQANALAGSIAAEIRENWQDHQPQLARKRSRLS